jgi:hypothetical protein
MKKNGADVEVVPLAHLQLNIGIINISILKECIY